MATEVSICSNALVSIGDKPIASFAENTDRALAASNLWASIRDSVLRSHPWNFCVKRVTVQPDSDTPDFDFSYQFTLPADWLRTLSVGEYGNEVDYRTESGKILCDEAELKLRYIYKNTNPALWDVMLVEAMTVKMAASLAIPVMHDVAIKQEKEREFMQLLKQARAVDGMDDPPQEFGRSNLLASRGAGGRTW